MMSTHFFHCDTLCLIIQRYCIGLYRMRRMFMAQSQCDACGYYEYDEGEDCYFCSVNLDEDEMGKIMQDRHYQCPYFQLNDEYKVVRKQM